MTYALEEFALLYVGSFAMSLLGEVKKAERSTFVDSLKSVSTPHFWKVGGGTPGAEACELAFDKVGFPLDPKKKMEELTWEQIESVCPDAAKEISSMAQIQIEHEATKVIIYCALQFIA